MKKLILFELRKVFSKRLALIALIGIILFSALLSFSTFQNKYAFDQNIGEGTGKTAVKIDKEIAAKYEGILTDEKVQQMMSDFAPTHDLHGLNAMYLYQNATQSAAFSRFSDKEGNWNGLSVSDVFGNEEIKIGYAIQQNKIVLPFGTIQHLLQHLFPVHAVHQRHFQPCQFDVGRDKVNTLCVVQNALAGLDGLVVHGFCHQGGKGSGQFIGLLPAHADG